MRCDTQTLRQDEHVLRGELETAGAVFKGPRACTCPFHDDKSASAGIYSNDAGIWRFKCHACGAGGDLFDVRSKITGKPVKDILREAAHEARPTPEQLSGRYIPPANSRRVKGPGGQGGFLLPTGQVVDEQGSPIK